MGIKYSEWKRKIIRWLRMGMGMGNNRFSNPKACLHIRFKTIPILFSIPPRRILWCPVWNPNLIIHKTRSTITCRYQKTCLKIFPNLSRNISPCPWYNPFQKSSPSWNQKFKFLSRQVKCSNKMYWAWSMNTFHKWWNKVNWKKSRPCKFSCFILCYLSASDKRNKC